MEIRPHLRTPDLKETIMNIHKNMEVIFVVALAAVGLGSFALDYLPEAEAIPPIPVVEHSIATPTSMAVVIVRAKRPVVTDSVVTDPVVTASR
jgi:hypothetical protein